MLTFVVVCPLCGETVDAVPVDTTWAEAEQWAYIAARQHQQERHNL